MNQQQFTHEVGILITQVRRTESWATDEKLAALFLDGAFELLGHSLQQRSLDYSPEAVRHVLRTYLDRDSASTR